MLKSSFESFCHVKRESSPSPINAKEPQPDTAESLCGSDPAEFEDDSSGRHLNYDRSSPSLNEIKSHSKTYSNGNHGTDCTAEADDHDNGELFFEPGLDDHDDVQTHQQRKQRRLDALALLSLTTDEGNKRCEYQSYTTEQRAAIGKYAAETSVKEAMETFAHLQLPGGTVRTWRTKYNEKLGVLKKSQGDFYDPVRHEVKEISDVKNGRPPMLGKYDAEVISQLQVLREKGVGINARTAINLAKGIIKLDDPCNLKNYEISDSWARSLFKRLDGTTTQRPKKRKINPTLSSLYPPPPSIIQTEGQVRNETIRLRNSEDRLIFPFLKQETVGWLVNLIEEETHLTCTILDLDNFRYTNAVRLEMVSAPFLVVIGNTHNTVKNTSGLHIAVNGILD